MSACGVWPAARCLIAVLIDEAGRARLCRVALSDDARAGFVLWLAAAGADLVVDEATLVTDPIAHVARRSGVTVWIAGAPLVDSLRNAAGISRRGPRFSAAMLARLPSIPWLRSLLRRLEAPVAERQITLL